MSLCRLHLPRASSCAFAKMYFCMMMQLQYKLDKADYSAALEHAGLAGTNLTLIGLFKVRNKAQSDYHIQLKQASNHILPLHDTGNSLVLLSVMPLCRLVLILLCLACCTIFKTLPRHFSSVPPAAMQNCSTLAAHHLDP